VCAAALQRADCAVYGSYACSVFGETACLARRCAEQCVQWLAVVVDERFGIEKKKDDDVRNTTVLSRRNAFVPGVHCTP